ncbi:hypothetical protein [Bacillus wiedmannii]|uniref:hypothetical protein n=1 Tax=Bacillus wiedmannii TaxID=1890302 RepID=UPI000BF12FF5|nr:hypothetical protein [Bacillus wiedmannii]PEN61668.1 hypothetical protein CN576_21805 [Bacillus wiedmannii]
MTMQSSTTKPKLIILEGVDRSGKDSMQDAIDSITRYKHMVMDRGPIGFKAYCEIFNKDEELFKSYDQMEKEMFILHDVLVIYIDCDTEVLVDRCLKTDHELLDFNYHKFVYEKFFNESRLDKIKVDTTKRHVREIVQDLVREGIL